jgi:hypothetical protein
MTQFYYLCDLNAKAAISVMPKPSTFANRITGLDAMPDEHLADLGQFGVPGYGFLTPNRLKKAGISAESIAACDEVMKKQMIDLIDNAVAERCAPPQRFVVEYQDREAQARAYVNDYSANPAAGKTLQVPPRIAGFAKAAQLDPYEAAQLTVKQADAIRAALGQLADLRMRKYEVERAATPSEAQGRTTDILSQIAAVYIP